MRTPCVAKLLLSRILVVGTTWAAALVVAGPSSAVAAVRPPEPVLNPGDPGQLAAWADPLMARHLAEYHVPGAVLVVVEGGQVVLAKGYGLARREPSRPVDPERTIFRVASISKVFTATAAMQLVERGRLSLDRDVNAYLTSFKLPASYPRPVTLFHLLTHTGGFDERLIARKARRAEEVEPLAVYLARRMPPRVMDPGEFISYSNHGMALAGHLIEQTTGRTFERYMRENVFRPLGMRRSGFEPPGDTPDFAVGTRFRGDGYRSVPFDFVRTVPASMLTTTGTDMARFMIAHLQNGVYEGTRILSDRSARAMHRRQFSQHPLLPGIAFGFWERFQNGQRALWHDGDLPGFASLLYLLPERGVGLFVAYDGDGGNEAREELLAAFLDRCYPVEPRTVKQVAGPDASRFSGTYLFNRRVRRGLEKIASQGETAIVRSRPGGVLELGGRRFFPAGPLLFEREDGKSYLAFKQDAEGRITHLFAGSAIARVYERRLWYEAPGLHLLALTFCAVAFLATVVASLRDRFRSRRGVRVAQPPAWTIATVVSALNLTFLAGFVLLMAGSAGELEYRVPPALVGLLVLPLASAALTLLLPFRSVAAWRWPGWRRGRRWHFAAVAVAALGWIVLLGAWNLLGFRT